MPRSKSRGRRSRASNRLLAAGLWSVLAIGIFGTIWWVVSWSDDGAAPVARVGADSRPPGGSTAPSVDWPGDPDRAPSAEPADEDVSGVARSAGPVMGPGRVAVVIDDLGRSVETVRRLGRIGAPITYAVLPYESHTKEVVEALQVARREMILHLPMQAKGAQNPGPGALSVNMTPEQVREVTARALDQTPGAIGVNNHMGSAFTANEVLVAAVMEEVASRRLIFLDSRTTPETVGAAQARAAGVPWVERSVFLDNERDEEAIRAQFLKGVAVAAERGQAVLIGHPYPETIAVLEREIPAATRRGFEFVTVSELAGFQPPN